MTMGESSEGYNIAGFEVGVRVQASRRTGSH